VRMKAGVLLVIQLDMFSIFWCCSYGILYGDIFFCICSLTVLSVCYHMYGSMRDENKGF
jgi:hypothetical protein